MSEGCPLSLLLRLYAFPCVAAIAAVAGACIVRHPWAKRLLVALAVVLIMPVPIDSRPPGVILPLGIFLILADAFPKTVCLIVFHVACLSTLFLAIGIATGALKRWIARDNRRATMLIVFGFFLACVAVGTAAVVLVTYQTAFDTAFREMKYPNAEVEEPMRPCGTISEGYKARWKTTDSIDAVMPFYKRIGFGLYDCSPANDGTDFAAYVADRNFWTFCNIQIGRYENHVGITVWVARRDEHSIRAVWEECV
jgi:hypothetical protein